MDGCLVGEPARRQAISNPEGTVTAAKRKMGTDHVYRIYGKEYTPQQILSLPPAEDQTGRRGIPW